MDLQAEKIEIIKEILVIEDINLIEEIKSLLQSRSHDWFDDLSDEQQQALMKALDEADRGEGIPHEEALARLGL
ncbi:MAG TPA: hypothetical protein VGN20_20810 [Mucilaginibacter sp.]|jgi:predicted transcriptional regulator